MKVIILKLFAVNRDLINISMTQENNAIKKKLHRITKLINGIIDLLEEVKNEIK